MALLLRLAGVAADRGDQRRLPRLAARRAPPRPRRRARGRARRSSLAARRRLRAAARRRRRGCACAPRRRAARAASAYVVVHPGRVGARAGLGAGALRARWSARSPRPGAAWWSPAAPGERALTAASSAGDRGRRPRRRARRCRSWPACSPAPTCVVVGNTGPAHLAAAVGTPVVSLFAPTVPAVRWRPVAGAARAADDDVPVRRLPRARPARCPATRACASTPADVRRRGRPARPAPAGGGRVKILLWHVHGSWTTAFVQGEHDYLVPVAARTAARTAAAGRGPGTGRVRGREVAARALRDEDVDVVVLQRPHELELAERGSAPRPGATCRRSTSSTTRRRADRRACGTRWPTATTSRRARHPLQRADLGRRARRRPR